MRCIRNVVTGLKPKAVLKATSFLSLLVLALESFLVVGLFPLSLTRPQLSLSNPIQELFFYLDLFSVASWFFLRF